MMKFWRDITTNTVTGEYSLKRIQAVIATLFSLMISMPFVLDVHLWPEQSLSVKEPPMELVYIWLIIALGGSAMIIGGRYFNRLTADGKGNPLEPACNTPKDTTTEQPKEQE